MCNPNQKIDIKKLGMSGHALDLESSPILRKICELLKKK